MSYEVVQGDITKMAVDAIVNPANTQLKRGGGACGAIFAAANNPKLQEDCNKLAPIETGQSVITMGYDLPATYIIHTVGPVWHGGDSSEEELLYSAYASALGLALAHDVKSIAFPLISAGIYGFPKERAREIADQAVEDFLENHEMDVKLVLFG